MFVSFTGLFLLFLRAECLVSYTTHGSNCTDPTGSTEPSQVQEFNWSVSTRSRILLETKLLEQFLENCFVTAQNQKDDDTLKYKKRVNLSNSFCLPTVSKLRMSSTSLTANVSPLPLLCAMAAEMTSRVQGMPEKGKM